VPAGEAGSRDGKLGLPQIIYGLLCDQAGRPVAVEVFSGERHDDATVPSQISKLKDRFGLSRIVVVADRGMVTKANSCSPRPTGLTGSPR
jgi:transposase